MCEALSPVPRTVKRRKKRREGRKEGKNTRKKRRREEGKKGKEGGTGRESILQFSQLKAIWESPFIFLSFHN